MLVFWLQKIVGIDTKEQSRVFNIASIRGGDGVGARDTWEKHKHFTLVTPARNNNGGGGKVRNIR